MNRIIYLAAALSIASTVQSAMAQEASLPTQQSQSGSSQNSSTSENSGMGPDSSGRTAAGGPVGLTRSEVRRQLYQAERSGQLQSLDRTLYQGGS